jgi:hypothetical protein
MSYHQTLVRRGLSGRYRQQPYVFLTALSGHANVGAHIRISSFTLDKQLTPINLRRDASLLYPSVLSYLLSGIATPTAERVGIT